MNQASKTALYDDLASAAKALIEDEPDKIANMANIAALIYDFLPDLNWAGFYRNCGDELVLGPFIGKPACVRIAMGAGVCGTAALQARSQCVEDVHAFPGHIACDTASNSELVVPVIHDGQVTHVIDLDSPAHARFDAQDQAGIEQLAKIITGRV